MAERLLEAERGATAIADRIRDARAAIGRVEDFLQDREGEAADSLTSHGDRLDEALEEFYTGIAGESGQRRRNDPSRLTSRLRAASRALASGRWKTPTQSAIRALERAEMAVSTLGADIDLWFGQEWAAYREEVEAAELRLLEGVGP